MSIDFRGVVRPILIGAAALVIEWLLLGSQQFSNAMVLGAIYALIALGYTMVYGIIELINFAHGDVFMVGSFLAMWILTTVFGLQGPVTNVVNLIAILAIVLLATMVGMGFIGMFIERVAYRPLRHAPRLAPLITAIGVSFILQNIIAVLFGPSPVNFPQIVPANKISVLGAQVPVLNVGILALAIFLMIVLNLFVGRTRLGRAMRSTAMDREAAELMGVDINLTIAITFFIAAALAGAGGMVQGLYAGSIQFTLGFYVGLKAFTAAVLGGIGNTTGAAIGGFVIAFVEVYATVLGYTEWSEVAVFSVLILVLVFRPSGLLGTQLGERA